MWKARPKTFFYLMLGNWLESLGLAGAAERGKALSPMVKL